MVPALHRCHGECVCSVSCESHLTFCARVLFRVAVVDLVMVIVAICFAACVHAQSRAPDLSARLRQYVATQDWPSALTLIDREITAAPDDVDLRVWRARLLTWSGDLSGAEHEYSEILTVSRADPDIWLGLALLYKREGKIQQAQQAIDAAKSLDPRRADIRAARGEILRIEGEQEPAKLEFQAALKLDSANSEARAGLVALRGEPRQELQFGQENDLLSYASAIHNENVALTSQWTSRWTTNVSGLFYQYYGKQAEKLMASATRREPRYGAITAGGAIAHDRAVIPHSEAFFGVDRGLKISKTSFVRGLEFSYDQHWYWYQSTRILALNGAAIFYLPSDCTFTLTAVGARSAFSGTGAEWKPSEMARTEFPVARWGGKHLFGNLLFAVGTEDFAEVDRIDRLAAQTYESGVRFQMTARQGVSEYVSYQKRTGNRTDIGFGVSYDVHF